MKVSQFLSSTFYTFRHFWKHHLFWSFCIALQSTTPTAILIFCGAAQLNCVVEIEAKMAELTFLDGLNGVDNAEQNYNCLPACTSNNYNYNIEISSAKFDFDKYYRTQPYAKAIL